MKLSRFLLIMGSLLWLACNHSGRAESEEIDPFPQTKFTFVDLYMRYLEDSREIKTIAKTFSKNIADELIPDTALFAVMANNIPLKKIAAGDHLNYYQMEEKYPNAPQLEVSLSKVFPKGSPRYELNIPLEYFGNIRLDKEAEDILIAWEGSSIHKQDQIIIILQDSKDKVHTFSKKGEGSFLKLAKNEWKEVNKGKVSLYLVRKSNSQKSNEEFGYWIGTEIYSQTLQFQWP